MRTWILLSLAACGSAAPPAIEAEAPPAGCELQYAITVDGATVTATVHNTATSWKSVIVPSDCLRQGVTLRGLPDGFDPDDACGAAQCVYDEIPPPDTRHIDPGETETLATWTIDADHGCGAPLTPGTYALTFDTASLRTSATICAPASAELVVPEPFAGCEPMPACGIGCRGPMATDENGCTLCACAPMPIPGTP